MTLEEAKQIPHGTKVISPGGKVGTIEDCPIRNRFTGRIDYCAKYVRMPSGSAIPLLPFHESFTVKPYGK